MPKPICDCPWTCIEFRKGGLHCTGCDKASESIAMDTAILVGMIQQLGEAIELPSGRHFCTDCDGVGEVKVKIARDTVEVKKCRRCGGLGWWWDDDADQS